MSKVRLDFVLGWTAIAILLLLVALSGLVLLQRPGEFHLNHYAAADRSIERDGPRPSVIFIGDSITERWPAFGTDSWNTSWLNRGIGGERSDQVRARFAQDVVALHPRAVVILVGTNDAWKHKPWLPLEATESNIAAMVTEAQSANIHVLLASVPPLGKQYTVIPPEPRPLGAEARIEAQNRWMESFATRTGAGFVDYWSVIWPAVTSDGIHPTKQGYRKMGALVDRAISRVLHQPT